MYEEYICNAARTMAETMKNADIPMYGSRLRLPDRKAIITLLKEMRQLMFPAYFGDPALMTLAAADYAALLLERIETSLSRQIALALPLEDEGRAPQIAREVVEQLPRIQQLLLTDIDAIFDGDPAAQNREEIVLAYPGLFAIFAYRVSHELYLRHVPTIPRMMTEYAHSRTGIDIHPGAQIGSYFFIDHGTGIVVGETTVIGDHVKLYQGVTLAHSVPAAVALTAAANATPPWATAPPSTPARPSSAARRSSAKTPWWAATPSSPNPWRTTPAW